MATKAEPVWKKRRCVACHRVKYRDDFATGWKRRCIDCSLCHGGCGRLLDYVALNGRWTCSPECEAITRRNSLAKAKAARYAKWRAPTRRKCNSCLITKPISEFHVQRRRENGEPREWSGMCKPCKRAYARELYAANADLRRRAVETAQRARERVKQRMASDPEFAREMAERKRRYNLNKRNRLPDARRVNDVPPKGRMPRLPAAPLGRLVERIVMREQARLENFETAEQAKTSRDEICKNLGCDARDLYAWSHGERQTVQFDVADRILLATGLNWYDVWPEEDFPKVAEFMEGA